MGKLFSWWAVACLALTSCGLDQDSAADDAHDDAYSGFTLGACDELGVPTRSDPRLTCARVDVPLDWSRPEGAKIELGVVRLEGEPGGDVGELWLLDGGPGGSGLGLVDAPWTRELNALGWDIYISAHRGTLGTVIDCPGVDAGTEACAELLRHRWGSALEHFNTKQAADDLAHLIRSAEPLRSGPVGVIGVSYGGFWAEVFATRHDGLVSAVVLDGVLPGDVDPAEIESLQLNSFVSLVELCTDNQNCSSRVEHNEAETFLRSARSAVAWQQCGGFDAGSWEDSAFPMLFGQLARRRVSRDFVPLLLSLVARCESFPLLDADYLFEKLTSLDPSWEGFSPRGSVRPLGMLVLHNSVMKPGTRFPSAKPVIDVGIRGELEKARGLFANVAIADQQRGIQYSTPSLVLAARFDLQTPLDLAERVHGREGEVRELIVFEGEDHVVLDSRQDEPRQCAVRMVDEFVRHPGRRLDTRCVSASRAPDPGFEQPSTLERFHAVMPNVDDPWSLIE